MCLLAYNQLCLWPSIVFSSSQTFCPSPYYFLYSANETTYSQLRNHFIVFIFTFTIPNMLRNSAVPCFCIIVSPFYHCLCIFLNSVHWFISHCRKRTHNETPRQYLNFIISVLSLQKRTVSTIYSIYNFWHFISIIDYFIQNILIFSHVSAVTQTY